MEKSLLLLFVLIYIAVTLTIIWIIKRKVAGKERMSNEGIESVAKQEKLLSP